MVHEEKREQQFALPGGEGKVVIDNLAGDVEVKGVDGDVVRLVAHQTARATTAENLAVARREMPLELSQRGDTVIAFVDGPFRQPDGGVSFQGDDYPYRVAYDFVVEVPRRASLVVRAVLDSEVRVRGVDGAFEVRNVNGPVRLEEIGGSGTASTVNDDLHVTFRRNPTAACDFGNVNGIIDVTFQPGLDAEVRYRTLNGEAWSDFPYAVLPTAPRTSSDRRNGRFVLKSEWNEGLRIGGGGPLLSFGTVNGNIYLRARGSAPSR